MVEIGERQCRRVYGDVFEVNYIFFDFLGSRSNA